MTSSRPGRESIIPLDDPVALALLLLALHLEDVPGDVVAVLLGALRIWSSTACRPLSISASLVRSNSSAIGSERTRQAVPRHRSGSVLTVPEESGATERAQLLEPAAHLLQESVLLPLGGEILDLGVDGVELAQQAVQLLARAWRSCARSACSRAVKF